MCRITETMDYASLFSVKIKGFLVMTMMLSLSGDVEFVSGLKECTNIPTQLSSHTYRYALLTSQNQTWRDSVFAEFDFYNHHHPHTQHLTPTDESAWVDMNTKKKRQEEEGVSNKGRKDQELWDWANMYRRIKYSETTTNGGGLGEGFLKEVALDDVRLELESTHWYAQQTNLEYLLMLEPESLVWSFRKNAELATPGTAYGGWEDPSVELRGHFVGHYLSATAMMWASTHNDTLRAKMEYVVSSLYDCQQALKSGYLSAFPSSLFDRFEAIQPVWAPYYTIHKIMAGLLDQYLIAENIKAYKMLLWMVDYFSNRVQNVIATYSIERHYRSLNEETGGMNDVLYRLYTVSGDRKHLMLAHLFDKPCFLGLLAIQADSLSGFHTNTHIPIVIGSQMRYEVTGDSVYQDIGRFFMDIVNSSHAYATGGTSSSEFWSDPKRLADSLASSEQEESCTTYNMLKVSRHLFKWTRSVSYADYYERALINGVLSIQRGRDPGVMIYMLPLKVGASKSRSYHGWGTPFNSFWCCYGTGIESFSKLGDSIYFQEEGDIPGLYVVQFIPSTLYWRSTQMMLSQKVNPVRSWDPFVRVVMEFSGKEGDIQLSTLNVRIPSWTDTNTRGTLNDRDFTLPSPGNFLSVTRRWMPADSLSLEFPIRLWSEPIKDDRLEYASVQAIFFGPYLLAGLTDGDWNLHVGEAKSLNDWITPVPSEYNSHLISLTQDSADGTLVLTNSAKSITMEKLPNSGTDAEAQATFRLISADNSIKLTSPSVSVGMSVMLEPFNMPEMVVVLQGLNGHLANASATIASVGSTNSIFRVAKGLDGSTDTISLELQSRKGCFLSTDVNLSAGKVVRIACKRGMVETAFRKAASFRMTSGLREYHPISFKVKASNANFLMEPLYSLRDETYTVYFNVLR